MMRKNNTNNNRNGGGMKHRNNNSGGGNSGRRFSSGGGGHNGGANRGNDAGNIQRQKHHATQQLGKYADMARNAQINGDRVDVEYYLQHVEHYTRVLTDIGVIEAERYAHQREQQIVPGGPNDPNAHQHQTGGHPQDSGENQHVSQEPATSSQATGQEGSEAQPVHQPRPRQPRRPSHYQAPAASEPSDNGAKEANSNTQDIPLPDSILPPI